MRIPTFLAVLLSSWVAIAAEPETELTAAAQKSLQHGVEFFHRHVARHGGYVYKYSADLQKSEGEGETDRHTIWVEPPGTPSVGMAFLTVYERTKDAACLVAAKDAGEALIQGQFRSGGWAASITFDPEVRVKYAYRVDPPSQKRQYNVSTFDDDKTPAAMRFLMHLDRVLDFKDERVHESVQYALDAVLKAQFPNGGWAQSFEEPPNPADFPVRKASYPDDWPRMYPGGNYNKFYTFNDNNISRTIETLLLAGEIYGEARYRDAALKAGDFIILAQMPEPQPAWAQQYDFDMHPVWARKFEPASVTGGESQPVAGTLMDLFIQTGDRKFLEPVPKALDYFRRSLLPNGKLARFYELKTNRPLYMTKDYQLTYDDSDVPDHYAFQINSNLDRLQKRYDEISRMSDQDLQTERDKKPKLGTAASLAKPVSEIIAAQDDRGAWVEHGRLNYYGKSDDTDRIISAATFIKHLDVLSQYLAAETAAK